MLNLKIKNIKSSSYNALDVITGAVMAYSIYKLYSAATKCVRVRRSSDDTEADIGFSGNYIDIVALNAHLGASNGYVTKWYNQYSGGNDAVQATKIKQPKISKTTGEIFFDNPIYSDGPLHLSINTYAASDIGGSPISFYANIMPLGARGHIVARPNTTANSTSYGIYRFIDNKIYFTLDTVSYTFTPTFFTVLNNEYSKILLSHNGTTVSSNKGIGILTQNDTDTTYAIPNGYMLIGANVLDGGTGYYFYGYMKTVIMFSQDKRNDYSKLASKC